MPSRLGTLPARRLPRGRLELTYWTDLAVFCALVWAHPARLAGDAAGHAAAGLVLALAASVTPLLQHLSGSWVDGLARPLAAGAAQRRIVDGTPNEREQDAEQKKAHARGPGGGHPAMADVVMFGRVRFEPPKMRISARNQLLIR